MENKFNVERYEIGKVVSEGVHYRVFEVTAYKWFEEIAKVDEGVGCGRWGDEISFGFCNKRWVEYVSRGYLRDYNSVHKENSVFETEYLKYASCDDMSDWEKTGNEVDEGLHSYISYNDSEGGETFVENVSVDEMKKMVEMLNKMIAFKENK